MQKIALRVTLFLILSLIFPVVTFVAASKDIVTYEKDIKKIVDSKCSKCHGSDSPTLEEFREFRAYYKKIVKYPRIDTYEYLMVFVNGEDVGTLQSVLDNGKVRDDGKPGSMYKYLGNTDEERAKILNLFKEWIGDWQTKTLHNIQDEIDAEWVEQVLEGVNTPPRSIDKIVKEITDKIKAVEK